MSHIVIIVVCCADLGAYPAVFDCEVAHCFSH
jgi:hypothetical protein